MKFAVPKLLLGLQTLLLAIELFGDYDTLVRRLALALTNILGVALLWWVAQRFARAGRPLPTAVPWLVVAGIWFDAAGNFAGLYADWAWWDKVAHVVGTAAVTAATWHLVTVWLQRVGARTNRWLTSLTTIGLTTVLAVVYEISEYLGDLLVATQRVTDLYDTADDLLFNLVATLIVVAILAARQRTPTIDPGALNR